MSTRLNLASRPFSNRSLPWVVAALVIAVSMVSLVFIVKNTRQANQQAWAVQIDINALVEKEKLFRKEAEAVGQSLTPEQRSTLTAAHTLVDRKRFSWSALFGDLESALPGNVRVKRIAVRGITTRADQTLAELELTVVAKSPSVVTEMIAEMERGGVMQAELRSQNEQRGRGETGAEYELYVVYRPRAGAKRDNAALASAEPAIVARGVIR